ncbi:MAG: hypothetical protein D4R79_17795 [Comamonadaceae bacterium]|nr:MAG: hypothetical protein D4R79_17795 [Comamonadaceae bacterium]
MSEFQTTRLGDITTKVGSGSTPRGGESAYQSEGIPLIRSMNVHFDGFRRDGLAFLNAAQAAALKNVEVRANDVLLNITGASIGRVTSAPTEMDGARVNQHVCIIRPDDRLESSFLRWFLASPSQQRLINGIESGATRQALTKEKILDFEIPLPAVDQQREIVAELEKQFSRLDEAVANLQRVKANLKRYKASVLKDAVEGRLVPTEAELARREGCSFETGEQLLQRILETRCISWIGRGKFKTPDALETMGLLELPSGWAWTSVEQIAEVISGLTKNPTRESLPLKLPYLRVANVYANELRLDDMAEIGVADNELQKLMVLKNDLLVVEGNGSPDQIGRVAKWDGSISPCVHQNHLIKVRAVIAEPDWMLNWLISPGGRKQIELVSSSTTGLHTLSSGKVGHLPVPLPPVAEQQRIVSEVDRRLSLIRRVETEVDTNLKRAERLRAATLQKSFGVGRLGGD